tara:strand:- start:1952 stop:2527 length:576 start_codon:yes stop_codon:yes gene_type:complete
MTEESRKKLIEYSNALDNLARIKSTDIFPNKNHQHAAIVLSKMLKYSKNSFVLFDDDLKGDIVKHDEIESFRDSVIDFISRGGNLKVVISDKSPDDDPSLKNFLNLLIKVFPNQVELKLATSEFKSSMRKIFNEKINFAIGDNNKYRLELFGNNATDSRTRAARGSFNNKEVSSKLLEAFNSKYSSCIAYS